MPATLDSVVTKVSSLLRGQVAQTDASTYLTAACTSGDLTLSVFDGQVVSAGVVEIDDEQILVQSTASGTLTIPPFGRGFNGTQAVPHLLNARVLVNPTFPRKDVVDAVGDTARAIYPTLFAPKSVEFSFSPAITTYNLAADCDRILRVTTETIGPTLNWRELDRYDLDTDTDLDAFPSGRSITLRQAPEPGRTVRVIYAGTFAEMTQPDDTLADAGFAESHADVLAYGAVWRLVQFVDVSRLQQTSVENQERAQYAPAGAATSVTRSVYALFQQRLTEERQRLLLKYPTQLRFGRS